MIEQILNAALTIPRTEQQLSCSHDKVTVITEDDRYYADCADCHTPIKDYNWTAWYEAQDAAWRELCQ